MSCVTCRDCGEEVMRRQVRSPQFARCPTCYQRWEGGMARRYVEKVARLRKEFRVNPSDELARDILKLERGSADAKDFIRAVTERHERAGRSAARPKAGPQK